MSAAPYADVMFFLFGLGTKRQHLGPGETRTCPNCNNTTQWARVRQYEQFSLFFVPVARWKRRQMEVCGICGTTVAV
jgi:hypothetical protein